MLIYTPHISPRHHYVFRHIFDNHLGMPYRLTAEREEYQAAEGPCLNYSAESSLRGIHIGSSGLLESSGIDPDLHPGLSVWENEKVLFPMKEGALPFDIFSMMFFLLSRYEEYGSKDADIHGRFPASASAASHAGRLRLPWADLLLEKFRDFLKAHDSALVFKKHSYRFQPTIDIDSAYAYRGKPWWRQLGSGVSAMMRTRFAEVKDRLEVLRNQKADPYDVYALLKDLHAQSRPIFFFLLADYGKMDKNLPWDHELMRSLVKELGTWADTGIHPSYSSSEQSNLLALEKERLEELIGHPVLCSRQHYLRFSIPDTFDSLYKSGIRHEYSMGYAESVGFRASTAHPFYFYDLRADKETALLIHPFVIMDVSLKNYMKLDPVQAMGVISDLVAEVKQVKGELVSLWHNESLSEHHEWKEWRKVYTHLLNEAAA